MTPELLPWADEALCKTTEGNWVDIPTLPFREQRRVKAVEIAICGACPVMEECREHAIEYKEPLGVWGGLVPRERGKIRAERKRQTDTRCGSLAGVSAHRRREEPPCDACRLVWNKDNAQRRRDKRKAKV